MPKNKDMANYHCVCFAASMFRRKKSIRSV